MTDHLLWEVQTLAANIERTDLLKFRALLEGLLGSKCTNEIIEQWKHEVEPPEHLQDAWARYQRGEDVSESELRYLDEWRADAAGL